MLYKPRIVMVHMVMACTVIVYMGVAFLFLRTSLCADVLQTARCTYRASGRPSTHSWKEQPTVQAFHRLFDATFHRTFHQTFSQPFIQTFYRALHRTCHQTLHRTFHRTFHQQVDRAFHQTFYRTFGPPGQFWDETKKKAMHINACGRVWVHVCVRACVRAEASTA